MEARCRLCAECSVNSIPILDNAGFCTKIFHLFQIKVSECDDLPTGVCNECFEMVEKVWNFNDRIQRAQELLVGLVQTSSMLSKSEPLENQAVVSEVHDISINNNAAAMVELQYIETKNISKCDFLGDGDHLSEESVKSENQGVHVKSKVKSKKGVKKKIEVLKVTSISDIEFSLNEDGSIIPKNSLEGWDSYPWTCCECNLVFSLGDELKDHWITAHGSPVCFVCMDCSKIYTKYVTFISHVRAHRPHLSLSCDVCRKWFTTTAEEERHRTLHHSDDRPHGCATCGKKFRMQSALLVHVRSHLPAEIKNRYQCDECPKKFGTKPNLMAHKRIHRGVRAFTCDQCGKSFIQKGNLDNHMLTHTVARPYSCGSCGKSFKTLIRLRKHASVHSGLKPHKCDVCGREFRERGTLKEHHRIHTGAMPFTCEFCGKCFRFKGVLTTHRRQHTGERPYSCAECQHHFTNWPNYNKHMKRRHGVNTSTACRTKKETSSSTGDVSVRQRRDDQQQSQQHIQVTTTAHVQEQLIEQHHHPMITETYVTELPAQTIQPAQQYFHPFLGIYSISEDLLQPRV